MAYRLLDATRVDAASQVGAMPSLLVVPGRPNVEVLLELGLPEMPAVNGYGSMPLDLDISLCS